MKTGKKAFELLHGTHYEPFDPQPGKRRRRGQRRQHTTGDIVMSFTDLVKKFPDRFRRRKDLDEVIEDEPIEVEVDDKPKGRTKRKGSTVAKGPYTRDRVRSKMTYRLKYRGGNTRTGQGRYDVVRSDHETFKKVVVEDGERKKVRVKHFNDDPLGREEAIALRDKLNAEAEQED